MKSLVSNTPKRVQADFDANGPKPSHCISARNIVIYGFLVIAALYWLLPLYVMIITSLKGLPEIRLGNVFAPPMQVTFEPWVKAWDSACTGLSCEGLKIGFWNSVRILVPSVFFSVSIAALNGYVLSFWRFRGSEIFFTFLLFGAFIPYQIMLYPLAILLGKMNLFSTLGGIVLIHTMFGMPILTLLFRNHFSSVPQELFKAARIDGAGFWRIFLQIMLPMSLPILMVAIIMQVTGIWSDFLFGLVYAGNDHMPMTVQLNNIVNTSQGVQEYNVNMAATLLTAAVPLALYFISGKLFIKGIQTGAVKG